MKKLQIALLIASGALTSTFAQADASGKVYAGGSFQMLSVEDADFMAVSGRVGSFFGDYVAAEARVGLGVVGDDGEDDDGKWEEDLNYLYGVYLRGGVPVNASFFPYVLLGYSEAELEWSYEEGESDSESDSDISYGVGLDYKLTERLTLNAEYAKLMDVNSFSLDGFSLGAVFSF